MSKHPILQEIETIHARALTALTRTHRREEIDLRGLDRQSEDLYRKLETTEMDAHIKTEATRALGQLIRTMDELEQEMGDVITKAKEQGGS